MGVFFLSFATKCDTEMTSLDTSSPLPGRRVLGETRAAECTEEDSAAAGTLCLDESGLWKQAVKLWMEWHQAQERLTAAMFHSRHNTAQQAALMQEMDQLDQLRWRAVELSQDMLASDGE